jgi:hypothetical protein
MQHLARTHQDATSNYAAIKQAREGKEEGKRRGDYRGEVMGCWEERDKPGVYRLGGAYTIMAEQWTKYTCSVISTDGTKYQYVACRYIF